MAKAGWWFLTWSLGVAGCGAAPDAGDESNQNAPAEAQEADVTATPASRGVGGGVDCSPAWSEPVFLALGSSTVWLGGAAPVDLDGAACAPIDLDPSGPDLTSCEAWFDCGGCRLRVGRRFSLQPYRDDPWFVESLGDGDACPSDGVRGTFDPR